MANAKKRCKFCDEYFLVAELTKIGISSVCTKDECLKAAYTKQRRDKDARVAKKGYNRVAGGSRPRQRSKNPTAPPETRRLVRERDKHQCRFCRSRCDGDRGEGEVHHVTYRSQISAADPFRDHEANLILLCDEHHRLVHSSKREWQPVLRACLWVHYVDGQYLTVPETVSFLIILGWEYDPEMGWIAPD